MERRLARNKCFFTSFYGSLCQRKYQFDQFCSSFKIFVSNIKNKKPKTSIITGYVNGRAKNWWSHDITNSQGSITDTLTSAFGYHQLIILPTHLSNTSPLYIDLIFTLNPNLFTVFGIEKSLYTGNYHHGIVFGKTNLTVLFPPPYTRAVWD